MSRMSTGLISESLLAAQNLPSDADRWMKAQINLHELIGLQMGEGEARTLRFLLGLSMPAQEAPFGMVGIHAGELYSVPYPCPFRGADKLSL